MTLAKPGESIVRIMSADEIVARGGAQPERLLWPERTTFFAERAMRLRQLSRDHAAGGYLTLMTNIAQAQQNCLKDFPSVPVPDATALERAQLMGIPPLSASSWPRHSAWRDGLRQLIDRLQETVPDSVTPILTRLRQATDIELEQQADILLAGISRNLDVATAPFIGAALQVYWVHMVAACPLLRHPEIYIAHDLDNERTCPCCGSFPTASVTRSMAGMAGQRYLSCSLCGTQWNMVRIKCSNCLSTEHVSYLSLDRADATTDDDQSSASQAAKTAVLAEACDACGVYLKIMHTDREPFVDPVADDLATLALDVLLSDTDKVRHGTNLMLLFSGTDDATADPTAD